jgi:SAM-dependent methyltransferase
LILNSVRTISKKTSKRVSINQPPFHSRKQQMSVHQFSYIVVIVLFVPVVISWSFTSSQSSWLTSSSPSIVLRLSAKGRKGALQRTKGFANKVSKAGKRIDSNQDDVEISDEDFDHDNDDDNNNESLQTITIHHQQQQTLTSQVTSLLDEDNASSYGPAKKIYSLPALYDLAFGYRNFKDEVNVLCNFHKLYTDDGNLPTTILEVAAGPARHSLQVLRKFPQGIHITALDASPAMVEYGTNVVTTERYMEEEEDDDDDEDDEKESHKDPKGINEVPPTFSSKSPSTTTSPSTFEYYQADMRDITNSVMKSPSDEQSASPQSHHPQQQKDILPLHDTAWILLGSLQHMTTNDDVIRCFRSIHTYVREGGTLILELPHPREIFSMVECTRNGWEVPLEDENGIPYGELQIVWGDEDDIFDPIQQIRHFTISMDVVLINEETNNAKAKQTNPSVSSASSSTSNSLSSVKETVPIRLFTYQEIQALAQWSGWDIVATYGALDDEMTIDHEEAFRLVCVLRKPKTN